MYNDKEKSWACRKNWWDMTWEERALCNRNPRLAIEKYEDRKRREMWEKVWRMDYGQSTTSFGFDHVTKSTTGTYEQTKYSNSNMKVSVVCESPKAFLKALGILLLMGFAVGTVVTVVEVLLGWTPP